jgi:thermostable 8-oxoguanine DNA glycosylase
MITAFQIANLRKSSIDFEDTQQLKDEFAKLRADRHPFYLTADEFDRILKWKLRGQYGRQRDMRAVNTDEVIRAVTGLALTITHEDKDYELELRINVLCGLRGVSVPVASAVLALVFPDEYAVIDRRNWRQVFDESREQFYISHYRRYLREIRRLAQELGWPVQEVDLAIWEYDRRHGTR